MPNSAVQREPTPVLGQRQPLICDEAGMGADRSTSARRGDNAAAAEVGIALAVRGGPLPATDR